MSNVTTKKRRVKAIRTAHIDPDKLYSPAAAATLMGLSRQSVIRVIEERAVPVVVLDRPETLHKGRYRTIRIQGAEIIRLLNGLEKRL